MAFLLTVGSGFADDSSDKILYDARSVHDMAALPAAPPMGRNWAVLRIVPGQDSGAALMSGVTMIRGKWQRVASANDLLVPDTGSYEWTEHQKAHERQPDPANFYSPFATGGLAICGYDARESGAAKFDPVFLLPADWESAAASFVQTRKEGAKPLSPGQRDSDVTAANPIVAVLAYRQLLALGELKPELLNSGLTHGDRLFRATITYLTLMTSSHEQQERLFAVLESAVRDARADSEREPAALGAFALELFGPHGRDADEAARILHLAKDLAARAGGQADTPLAGMIKLLGW